MKLFLKLTFKQLYHFFRNPAQRHFSWLALKLGDAPRYRPVRTRLGNWQLSLPDGQSFVWQYKEIFAEQSYHFPSVQAPIIFDCGANLGLASLYFVQQYPDAQVVAFEADPAIFQHLQHNLQHNGASRVQCINKAVWMHDRGVHFASEGADGGSIVTSGNSVLIPSVDLRDEMRKFPHIDFLKMDIEGAETEVLLHVGNELQRVQHLFVEYHSYVGRPQELGRLLRLIEEQGFRYFIRPEADRRESFMNRVNRSNPAMDLQINIFAYRS